MVLFLTSCTTQSFISTTSLSQNTPIIIKTVTPTTISPTASVETLITFTPSPSPVFHKPTETKTITQITNTEVSIPEIIKICPENREVSLLELGINPNFRLVIMPQGQAPGEHPTAGLLTISGIDPSPRAISNTIPKSSWIYDGFQINPNGQWFSFAKWQEGDEKEHIMISSLDGEQQWEIGLISETLQSETWWNDHEIVVLEYIISRSGTYPYIPISLINPFTGDIQRLSPLPKNAWWWKHFYFNNNHYIVYYEGNAGPIKEFTLYSYTDNTSKPIFKWLTGKDWVGSDNFSFYAIDGNFTVDIRQHYGLDLAVDISLDEAVQETDYGHIMKAIKLLDLTHAGISEEILPGVFNLLSGGWVEGTELKWHIYKYYQSKLIDYCTITGPSYVSPDKRFMAITDLYELGSRKRELIVLDLETGKFARIPGFSAIGWGVAP